ncbi:MAG: TraR/DksA family transcriptional regulator [Gammaproteobacteria bacterium]|nr:MAG: TraR/DksA family transcriptional regulator [Gammaproteobacteria bacterium]
MNDADEFAHFRQRLLALQKQLLDLEETGSEAGKTVELDQARVGRLSRMDALLGQAMSQAMNQRRQIELQKIEAALQRIESGEYGYCISCEEPIARARLEHDPAVPLCISCASAAEQD